MPQVSANWLARHTGKDWRTISKRIDRLARNKRGYVDSATALEAIYCGVSGENGEVITGPEAVRLLNIAKKSEIELDMEIKRGERLPRSDVELAHDEVFKSIAGVLKANRDKQLTEESINEIFDQFRSIGTELLNGHD